MRLVVFAAYDGVSLLDLAGPLEALRVATAFAGSDGPRATYECLVASSRGGRVATADGVTLHTQPLRTLRGKRLDTLIVPGAFRVDDVLRDRTLMKWIATRGGSFRRVCSVCIGSFMLAQTGLLDGRRAATHWMHAERLAMQYPKVRVEPDAIYVRDGRFWSSAGVTSGIDMALSLIEHDAGRQLAIKVARILVVYLKRAGGQSQYSTLLAGQEATPIGVFEGLERWLGENLRADLSVEALAARAHMSSRNFARAYKESRGRTPAKAVQAIRIDAARRLLEDSDDRIKTIAAACGFANEERMRAAFVRVLGIAPREFRKRFSSNRARGASR